MKRLRFVKASGIYNAGEVAGFIDEVADLYLADGAAVLDIEEADAEAAESAAEEAAAAEAAAAQAAAAEAAAAEAAAAEAAAAEAAAPRKKGKAD